MLLSFLNLSATPSNSDIALPTVLVCEWTAAPSAVLGSPLLSSVCPQVSPFSGHKRIDFSFHYFSIGNLFTTQDGLTLGHLHLPSQITLPRPLGSASLEASSIPHFFSSVRLGGLCFPRFLASYFQIGSPLVLPLSITELGARHIFSSVETKHSTDSLSCQPCSLCQKCTAPSLVCPSPAIVLTLGTLNHFICSWVRYFPKTRLYTDLLPRKIKTWLASHD